MKFVIYANHGPHAGISAVSELFEAMSSEGRTTGTEGRTASLATVFDHQGMDRAKENEERFIPAPPAQPGAVVLPGPPAPRSGWGAVPHRGRYGPDPGRRPAPRRRGAGRRGGHGRRGRTVVVSGAVFSPLLSSGVTSANTCLEPPGARRPGTGSVATALPGVADTARVSRFGLTSSTSPHPQSPPRGPSPLPGVRGVDRVCVNARLCRAGGVTGEAGQEGVGRGARILPAHASMQLDRPHLTRTGLWTTWVPV